MNIICAYTINLDAVHNVRGEEISRISAEAKAGARERITSLEDLISALLFCMQEGSGAELLIERGDVARRIEGLFPWIYRLGGNAGIMANVLASLGARPILNAPAISRRMAGMLDHRVRVPIAGALQEPLFAAGDEEMTHFVFQFAAGEAVSTRGGRIVARRDNRLIASYDPENARLHSTPDFDAYCLNNIKRIDGALVSGFNLVPFSGYRDILEKKIAQIASWKKANPDIFIHAEMGSFQRPEMMEYLLERLPVESIGMNEDELATIIDLKKGWQGLEEAVLRLNGRLDIPRVAVHTSDYILSAWKGLLAPQKEVEALTCGADAAAALAATGDVRGPVPEEINAVGLDALEQFLREGAEVFGRGAYRIQDGTALCLVPSRVARRPRITVGLGDTATAAILHQELLARKADRSASWSGERSS